MMTVQAPHAKERVAFFAGVEVWKRTLGICPRESKKPPNGATVKGFSDAKVAKDRDHDL